MTGLGLLLASCGRVEQSPSEASAGKSGAMSSSEAQAGAPDDTHDGGAGSGPDSGVGGAPDAGPALCDGGGCGPTAVCKPDAKRCVGTQVSRCNASGSDWLTAVACPDGQLCLDEGCKKPECEPLAWYCQAGSVYRCNEHGEFGSAVESCDPEHQRCVTENDGSPAHCSDACKPGTKLCVLNGVGTCNDDGSPPKGGIPCAFNERCQDGECKALPCEVLGNAKACVALPCVPGESGCVLDQVGTCGADGKSLSQVTEDCKAEGNVCTADQTCAKSFVDIIAAGVDSETVPANTLVGDVIYVRWPRKLIELQTWIAAVSGTRKLHWVAYELIGNTFVLGADKLVVDYPKSEFHSSGVGSFSYQLEAGKTYLVGVVVPEEGVTRPTNSAYAEQLSFGVLEGSLKAPYAASIDVQANQVRFDISSHLRVTTASP